MSAPARRPTLLFSRCLARIERLWTLPLFALVALGLLFLASVASSQQNEEVPREEIVANLAAGRVVIAVVKGAILVGTIENPIEVQSRLPSPVQLSSERLAVPLGAVDWFSPSSQETLARIDTELPHLHAGVVAKGPHLSQAQPEGGDEASDIESIGQGVMERLNQVANGLHTKIQQPPDEPLTQLIVVDYLTGYGPEVWQVSYEMEQEQQRGDFWDTRVLRPKYLQFWPPEKGQPHTLVEFAYPPENAPTSLIDLLRQNDPRLVGLLHSDPKMGAVAAQFLQGDSKKIRSEDATQFLRAALAAIASPNERETFAAIGEETGFAWILAPPAEPKTPALAKQPPRPADAPSLIKHPD
jgi:hypothetical protein